MLDGVEPGEASEHDDWTWFAVVARPAAEPGHDPRGIGERAFRVGVFLFVGFAFEASTNTLQGRSISGIEGVGQRPAFASRSATNCITVMAAIRMAVASFSSGPCWSWRSASTSKPFVFMVRNNCSIIQRAR
jgi:hypothetical protein